MKVLVIIPAYNEEKSIERVVSNLREACPQADYLIVNACSTDWHRVYTEKPVL